MSAAIRLQAAQEKVAELSDAKLTRLAEPDECWRKAHRVGKLIIMREQFRRGLLSAEDLSPEWRRRLVDPDNLDLHAIAAAPIMDPLRIYCPLGKLSMAEAKAREASQVSVL